MFVVCTHASSVTQASKVYVYSSDHIQMSCTLLH